MAITPIRLDGLLSKIESTYGTDSAPVAGTDGVRGIDRLHSNIGVEHAFLNTRSSATGKITFIAPAARTGRVATITIAWDARGAGAAYSASVLPEADSLLRACAMARTDDFTVSSENVSYAPADTSHDSTTIHAYAGNKLYKIVGCRGSWKWPVSAGAFGRMEFVMQGLVTADPTEVAVPSITYDAAIPPTAVGMSLSVGGWSPDVVTAEVDQASVIARLPSANAADGIVSFEISEMNPFWNLSAKMDSISNYDPWANMKASTANTITQTLGSVQYNRILFDVTSAAYLESISNTDQDAFAGVDLSYQLTSYALKFN